MNETVRRNKVESSEEHSNMGASKTTLSGIQDEQNLLQDKLKKMLQQSVETEKKLQKESDETNKLLSNLSLCHEAMMKENQTRDKNISILTKAITETNQTLQNFRTATNKSLDNIMAMLTTIQDQLGTNTKVNDNDSSTSPRNTMEEMQTQKDTQQYHSPPQELTNPSKKAKTSELVKKMNKVVTPPANNGMSGGGAE